MNNCFNGRDSVCDDTDFKRRFGMPRAVFNRIHDRLMGMDPFAQKEDPTGELGIRPPVKLVACLCFLACGDAHNREDENPRIGQSALNAFVRDFCRLVTQEF